MKRKWNAYAYCVRVLGTGYAYWKYRCVPKIGSGPKAQHKARGPKSVVWASCLVVYAYAAYAYWKKGVEEEGNKWHACLGSYKKKQL